MPSQTLSDRLLAATRNNRYLAVIVVAATIIGAVATFTNAVSSAWGVLAGAFGWGGSRVLYRALGADLRTLDMSVDLLADNRKSLPFIDGQRVRFDLEHVEADSKPVCDARKSVSELGDTSVRTELDQICFLVGRMRQLDAMSGLTDGLGAVAIAVVLDSGGLIDTVRAKIARGSK